MNQRKRTEASLEDVLRRAVRTSGKTPYRVAKDIGTTPEVVSRFLKGADIRISTASRLAESLALELRPRG
jgi:hypothetical protein